MIKGNIVFISGLLILLSISFSGCLDGEDTGGYSLSLNEGWTDNIIFPCEIWRCNSSIGKDDTCENFLQQGGVWDNVDWIFRHNIIEDTWTSWWIERPDNELTHMDCYEDHSEFEYNIHALVSCTLEFEYDGPYVPPNGNGEPPNGNGNGEPPPIPTFSCNSQTQAEYHLIYGDCEDPESWIHIYDLGETKRLVRITGTVEHKRGGASGRGDIRFYMSNEIPCEHGDIDWIRVDAWYNNRVSFDKYIDPMDPAREYKVNGRYLMIAASTTGHQMVFSEGTATFEGWSW